jgi:hypothetical protein
MNTREEFELKAATADMKIERLTKERDHLAAEVRSLRTELEKVSRKLPREGARVRLVHMGSDPQPVPDGTCGTVSFVDDIGNIHMEWDNGRTLALIPGEDLYKYL